MYTCNATLPRCLKFQVVYPPVLSPSEFWSLFRKRSRLRLDRFAPISAPTRSKLRRRPETAPSLFANDFLRCRVSIASSNSRIGSPESSSFRSCRAVLSVLFRNIVPPFIGIKNTTLRICDRLGLKLHYAYIWCV